MTTKNDEARAARLKAALRENLRRRKRQVRGRGEPAAGQEAAQEEGQAAAKDAAEPPDDRDPAPSDAPSS
ncbi:hypothetical protein MKK55_27360 [Methylobacterium sp. J-059]|uniref:hypothetical protein n=1 Tax=Methylobacterium sp. J-059 TaxID=2836643 RepID=UPI001FB9A22A|nr:hypothetical protein [Methylobacterium sp. J-059]MCJ2042637.1 hypothetical protein [Methylobacterium sp. J-059]